MNDNRMEKGNAVEFIVNFLNDIAELDEDSSLKEKIRKRVISLSVTSISAFSIDNIVTDFNKSNDMELHKAAEKIAPLLTEGKYATLFETI